jgi:hypothetical protein
LDADVKSEPFIHSLKIFWTEFKETSPQTHVTITTISCSLANHNPSSDDCSFQKTRSGTQWVLEKTPGGEIAEIGVCDWLGRFRSFWHLKLWGRMEACSL